MTASFLSEQHCQVRELGGDREGVTPYRNDAGYKQLVLDFPHRAQGLRSLKVLSLPKPL